MNPLFRKSFSLLVLLAGLSMPLAAQVTLKRGAIVYCGSASNTTAPAYVDETKLKEATKEWQKIQSEGIDTDSAQGKQLLQQMNSKVREAVKSIAQDESRDLVVRKDDIFDKQGKDTVDLTDKVVAKLGE
jgi:Skp family chaperone for outer membrane proteins